jgi:hypothetical protein
MHLVGLTGRLLTVPTMSVPHTGAFFKALMTGRQALASWYILVFKLPRIPEWCLTRGHGTFTLSGLNARQSMPRSWLCPVR